MRQAILISMLMLLSTSTMACESPVGWETMETENEPEFKVVAKVPEQPIQTGKQFNIDVMICSDTKNATQIEIDANMPAHKHGMNYLPEVSTIDQNIHRASGLFFHMPGQWQITVDLKGEKKRRFYLDVAAR